jgi:hypothetical protein
MVADRDKAFRALYLQQAVRNGKHVNAGYNQGTAGVIDGVG